MGQLWHSGRQKSSGGKTSWTDIICRLFDDGGHSDWCKVTSHCSFDLHFRVAHF